MKITTMTKGALIAGLGLWSLAALAESPAHNWSLGVGGPGEDTAGGVAVDGDGKTLCVGMFEIRTDLGGGSISAGGGRDIFLAKYGSDGSHLWSRAFGEWANDNARDVLALSDGSVVIAGAFRDSIDFGGDLLEDTGLTDGFLACFDADGVHRWSLAIGGEGSQDASGLARDSDDNIIVVGSFFTEVDAGNGPIASVGTSDVFVAKFTSLGAILWARGFGSTMGESDIYVDVDPDDDVVILGDHIATINLGGADLASSGNGSFYLAKLSGTDGSHVWSQGVDGINGVSANGLAVDSQGNMVCVGEFVGPLDLGSGVLTTAGFYTDLFVVKYGPGGAHVWDQAFGTAGYEPPADVVVDSRDNISFFGYHSADTDLDFGGGALPTSGGVDVYLVTLDAEGAHLGSDAYGDASMQTAHALAIGPSDETVLTGVYNGTPDFGGGPLPIYLYSGVFLVSLTPPWSLSTVPGDLPGQPVRLHQNVPNPFNPATTIAFELPATATVDLRVFDVSGRLVRTLLSGVTLGDGPQRVDWDGRDDAGRQAAAGVYFYRLEAGGVGEMRKMVLVK